MAYGSSDYAAEDYESMKKLDNMITEAKDLLLKCKNYIASGEQSAWSNLFLFEIIDDFIEKKV